MAKKLTNTDYLNKSKSIHGEKYEYIEEFKGTKTPIKIKCKKHNYIFKQRPGDHFKGNGCSICGNEKKGKNKTNNEFLKESNKLHNNQYKYLTKYTNSKFKIKIICKKCNFEFEQIPNDHLMGHSCPKCGGTYSSKKDFFKRCKIKHNNEYEYDYSSFKSQKYNIRLKCKIHGWITLNAKTHLDGAKCTKCSKKYRYKNMKEYSIEANKIHNNKYKYIGEYIKNSKKIKIECPEHGIFEMTPGNHLNGKNGCPDCKRKKARLRRIKEISKNKFNGYQVIPSFNPKGCEILNKISKIKNTHIQHAMNGGEFYIKKLGFWIDGYDKKNNIVYKFDEKFHFDSNKNLKKKDLKRQKEIENYLKCKFIRIDESKINKIK